jgi:hypothetical protein
MWMYLVATFMIPSTILVLAPFDIMLGVIVSIIVYLAIVIPMALTSPVIIVTDKELKVGKAHISRDFISGVSAFSGSHAFAARGTDLNARAWILLRGWINPVVRIDIDDPQDPTPYWLFSTRKPEELVAALRGD